MLKIRFLKTCREKGRKVFSQRNNNILGRVFWREKWRIFNQYWIVNLNFPKFWRWKGGWKESNQVLSNQRVLTMQCLQVLNWAKWFRKTKDETKIWMRKESISRTWPLYRKGWAKLETWICASKTSLIRSPTRQSFLEEKANHLETLQ